MPATFITCKSRTVTRVDDLDEQRGAPQQTRGRQIEALDKYGYHSWEQYMHQMDYVVDNPTTVKNTGGGNIVLAQSQTIAEPGRRMTMFGAKRSNRAGNGFVASAIECYNAHARWQLRPDDVWLAIMVQMSLYVNKNAEALRTKFVAHKGKKKVCVTIDGELRSSTLYVEMESTMREIVRANVSQNFFELAMPRFSTTTPQDETVAGFVMLAQMQAYFEYGMMLGCGIPEVTLEGTLEDWKSVYERLGSFTDYELPNASTMRTWSSMLRYIVNKFIRSYEGDVDTDFWDRVIVNTPLGSGDQKRFSGWISAFSAFDSNGDFQNVCNEQLANYDSKSTALTAELYSALERPVVELAWPSIDNAAVASGVVSAPLTITDYKGKKWSTCIVAGHFVHEACNVTQEGTKFLSDTFRPRSEWAIVVVKA